MDRLGKSTPKVMGIQPSITKTSATTSTCAGLSLSGFVQMPRTMLGVAEKSTSSGRPAPRRNRLAPSVSNVGNQPLVHRCR